MHIFLASSHRPLLLLSALAAAPALFAQDPSPLPSTWSHYGADAGGTRYSPLADIDRTNVAGLAQAWVFRTGELGEGSAEGVDELTFETTPVLFEGSLILTTGFGAMLGLDPVTGAERWRHDPAVPRDRRYSEHTNRGVAVWRDPAATTSVPCAARAFVGTLDARVVAVDARGGTRCAEFGDEGVVDLKPLAGVEPRSGDYQITSAPTVVRDVVVVGTSIGDNWSADTGPGTVRGLDARSGRVLWAWDPIGRTDATPGRVGAANAWSSFVSDPERDLVFVPTSSPSPDFYGGLRTGSNRWANSVVALRASTGEMAWGFQTVHHDLFDYDVAAPPLLLDIEVDGRTVPAVAQANKTGFVFVLDRETGQPLRPVQERPAPWTQVPGERASQTQPWPTHPAPLIDEIALDPERPWGVDSSHVARCAATAQGFRYDGFFTPPSLAGSVLYPGNGAGTNWGGTAWEPTRGLLIVPTSRFATLVRLFPRERLQEAESLAEEGDIEMGMMRGAPYVMVRRTWAVDGMACTPPPWGRVTAIDMASGEARWTVPWGEGPSGFEEAGFVGAGGPIATAGGLVFIAGSWDERIRALDIDTGETLWSAPLPRAGMATPMTYRGRDGRQYVVIAAGGHAKMGKEIGDYLVAFALPSGGG